MAGGASGVGLTGGLSGCARPAGKPWVDTPPAGRGAGVKPRDQCGGC